MRWFVEISSLGSKSGPPATICVEAPQWQPALQQARASRGDNGSLSNFSIELLEDGFRAIDPVARVRYLLKHAPDDAPLTNGVAAPPPAVALAAPAAAPAHVAPVAAPARAAPAPVPAAPLPTPVQAAPASVAVRAPAPAAVPVRAPIAPAPALAPAAAPSPGPAVVANREVGPAPRQRAETVQYASSGEALVAEAAAKHRAPAQTVAFASSGAAAVRDEVSAPVAPQPAPSVDASLPAYQVLVKREEGPSERSPLFYREYVFAVAPGTDEEAAGRLILDRFESVRAGMDPSRSGKLINLAVFDHVFQGRPQRRPIATLAWKDWKNEAPEIHFPEREAAEEEPIPLRSLLPVGAAATPAPAAVVFNAPPLAPVVVAAPMPQAIPVPAPAPVAASIPVPVSVPLPARVAPTPPAPVAKVAPAGVAAKTQPGFAKTPAATVTPFPAPTKPSPKGAAPAPAKAAAPKTPAAPAVAPKPAASPVIAPAAPAGAAAASPTRPAEVGPTESASGGDGDIDVDFDDPPPIPLTVAKPPVASAATAAKPGASTPIVPAAVPTGPVVTKDALSLSMDRGWSDPPPPPPPVPLPSAPTAVVARKRLRGEELLTELFEAFSDLQFLRDPLEGAQFVLDLTLEKLPSEVGLVSFFDMNKREFVIVRQCGGPRSALNARQPERAPIATTAMRKRAAVIINDAGGVARAVDDRWRAIGVELRCLVCTPVELGGRYLGLIELANPLDENLYDEGDGHALTYIGQQFAEYVAQRGVVIDGEIIRESTERMSMPPPGAPSLAPRAGMSMKPGAAPQPPRPSASSKPGPTKPSVSASPPSSPSKRRR